MLAHLDDLARRQIGKHELAIGGADQARDLQAKILQHAAYFAVLALGDFHLDPYIGAGAPL